jgi:cytochrome c oxidase cbb3-type subunit I/II
LPVRFTVLTTLAVIVASLFEIIPTFLIRSNIPTIASVRPYTPLELAGRDIYVSEGCYNCHSQMIRPMVAETKRYGEYSKPGEFVYDRPFQWGSRRIGPDLAREGGNKQTSLWHWQHLDDPSLLVEGSVMPAYTHLLSTSLDFDKIADRVHAAHKLGAPYDRELTESAEMARQQAERIAADIVSQGGTVRRGDVMTFDSQAVALIAYLQRLGTDLTAPVTPPAAPAEAPAAPVVPAESTADGPPASQPVPSQVTALVVPASPSSP